MSEVVLLVAEDEENVRRGIVDFIRKNATRIDTVIEAENGREALEAVFTHKPDLLLVDVQMPYKTGLDVISEAGEAGFAPKAVILSGHDEFHYAQQALRLGAVDYILKPCRPEEMLKKLESLLDGGQAAPADAQPERNVNRLVQVAVQYMEQNFTKDGLSLGEVAEYTGVTAPYLSSLFARELECGFSDHLNKIRLERACAFLHDPAIKTYEVAYKVGYRDDKYFTKVFKKFMGVSPAAYRKREK